MLTVFIALQIRVCFFVSGKFRFRSDCWLLCTKVLATEIKTVFLFRNYLTQVKIFMSFCSSTNLIFKVAELIANLTQNLQLFIFLSVWEWELDNPNSESDYNLHNAHVFINNDKNDFLFSSLQLLCTVFYIRKKKIGQNIFFTAISLAFFIAQ